VNLLFSGDSFIIAFSALEQRWFSHGGCLGSIPVIRAEYLSVVLWHTKTRLLCGKYRQLTRFFAHTLR